jgi:hypothetical protein
MSREVHVRFCERAGVRFPRATRPIVGFEHRRDAELFLRDLAGRLARFGLDLHPGKTRLIEFGRHAIARRRARGLGKPETFAFLGFTHYCATRRSGGGFVLGRTPVRERMRRSCVRSRSGSGRPVTTGPKRRAAGSARSCAAGSPTTPCR